MSVSPGLRGSPAVGLGHHQVGGAGQAVDIGGGIVAGGGVGAVGGVVGHGGRVGDAGHAGGQRVVHLHRDCPRECRAHRHAADAPGHDAGGERPAAGGADEGGVGRQGVGKRTPVAA